MVGQFVAAVAGATGDVPLVGDRVIGMREDRGRVLDGRVRLLEIIGDVADRAVRLGMRGEIERAAHPGEAVVEGETVDTQLAGVLLDRLHEIAQHITQG